MFWKNGPWLQSVILIWPHLPTPDFLTSRDPWGTHGLSVCCPRSSHSGRSAGGPEGLTGEDAWCCCAKPAIWCLWWWLHTWLQRDRLLHSLLLLSPLYEVGYRPCHPHSPSISWSLSMSLHLCLPLPGHRRAVCSETEVQSHQRGAGPRSQRYDFHVNVHPPCLLTPVRSC